MMSGLMSRMPILRRLRRPERKWCYRPVTHSRLHELSCMLRQQEDLDYLNVLRPYVVGDEVVWRSRVPVEDFLDGMRQYEDKYKCRGNRRGLYRKYLDSASGMPLLSVGYSLSMGIMYVSSKHLYPVQEFNDCMPGREIDENLSMLVYEAGVLSRDELEKLFPPLEVDRAVERLKARGMLAEQGKDVVHTLRTYVGEKGRVEKSEVAFLKRESEEEREAEGFIDEEEKTRELFEE